MRAVDIIHKKRLGEILSKDEISFLVQGYVRDDIPDYQMSAFAMAVLFQGMTPEETASLTAAMVESGDRVDLSEIEGVKVDKHSTGGVGDTTTLVLGPMVAALGVPIAKMSGRGLGHTGGTLDKLEAIPGFHTDMSRGEFIRQVKQTGLAVAGQTANLTPADKKLYALRDVTDTVQSIPLIASSIMSKKLASGADAIVLDVKVGDGAFMKDMEHARLLAEAMVSIGRHAKRETVAVLTTMEQPLGQAVGNALEVREAILTLRGEGPDDLTELCLTLGAEMVMLAGKAQSAKEAKQKLRETLESGRAIAKFKEFVSAQGGDPRVADDLSLLPKASVVVSWRAPRSGYVTRLHAEEMGLVAMRLGAGRDKSGAKIDPAVGLVIRRKVGESVNEGETIVEVHAETEEAATQALKELDECIDVSPNPVEKPALVLDVVRLNQAPSSESEAGADSDADSDADRDADRDTGTDLVRRAKDAMAKAYVPYSHFRVGAALRLSNGDIVIGANIENASYGLTNCAERTAMFRALMRDDMPHKERVVEIAVVADSDGAISPCGACRQVLAEHCDASVPVILADLKGDVIHTSVGDLLPYAFDSRQMDDTSH